MDFSPRVTLPLPTVAGGPGTAPAPPRFRPREGPARVGAVTAPSLRLAYLSNFAPRKLGSGEGRLIAFAREARRRGHQLTFFGGEPVHPEVAAALRAEGAGWEPIARLARHPASGGRDLARRFGESWSDYARSVRAFRPRLTPYRPR